MSSLYFFLKIDMIDCMLSYSTIFSLVEKYKISTTKKIGGKIEIEITLSILYKLETYRTNYHIYIVGWHPVVVKVAYFDIDIDRDRITTKKWTNI